MDKKNGSKSVGASGIGSAASARPHYLAELIESVRAHTASTAGVAAGAVLVLDKCYGYDEGEPHLGKCGEVIQIFLHQSESRLEALGTVSRDEDPSAYAARVRKECELEQESLGRSIHMTRAITTVLRNADVVDGVDVIPALDDLESGLKQLIEGFQAIAKASANQ